jgi:predicted Zn-dependent protease
VYNKIKSDEAFGDIWAFSLLDRSWREITFKPTDGAPPAPRYNHSAQYISKRGVVLIFGGYCPHRHFKDLVMLDLVNHTSTCVTKKTKTSSRRQSIISKNVVVKKDMWPRSRQSHVMYHDSATDKLFIHGGIGNSIYKNDIKSDVCILDLDTLFDAYPKCGIPLEYMDNSVRKIEIERREKAFISGTVRHNSIETKKGPKHYQSVVDYETEFLKKNPKDHASLLRRCFAYVKLQRWDDAVIDADSGIDLLKKSIDKTVLLNKLMFMRHKAFALHSQSSFKNAIEICTQHLRESGKSLGSSELPIEVYLLALKVRCLSYALDSQPQLAIEDGDTMVNTVKKFSTMERKFIAQEDFGLHYILSDIDARIGYVLSAYQVKVNCLTNNKKFDQASELVTEATSYLQTEQERKTSSADKKKLSLRTAQIDRMRDYISDQRTISEDSKNGYQEGRKLLDEYIKSPSKNSEKLSEALILLERSVQLDSHASAEWLCSLAEAQYLSIKYRDGAKSADAAISANSKMWRPYWIAGNCYIAKRKMAKGIDYFKRGLRIAEKDGMSELKKSLTEAESKKADIELAVDFYNQAQNASEKGSKEEARIFFTKAIEQDLDNIEYLCARSTLLNDMKRYDEALRDAEAATKQRPNENKGYLAQIACFKAQRLFGRAEATVTNALTVLPRDDDLQQEVFVIQELLEKQKFAQMEAQYARECLITIEQRIMKTPFALEDIYLMSVGKTESEAWLRVELDRVIGYINKAIEVYDQYPAHHLILAKCLYLQRKFLGCVKAVKEVIDIVMGTELLGENQEEIKVLVFESIYLGAQAYACEQHYDIAVQFISQSLNGMQSELTAKHVTTLKKLSSTINSVRIEQNEFIEMRKKAQTLYFSKDYKGSLQTHDRLVQNWQLRYSKSPQNVNIADFANAHYERALCLFELKKYDACVADCGQATTCEPFPHYYELLCRALFEMSQHDQALQIIIGALNLAPYNTMLNTMWARIRLKTAVKEAEKDVQSAIKSANPNDIISLLSKSLEIRPFDVKTRLERAKAYKTLAMHRHVIRDCKVALKGDPNKDTEIPLILYMTDAQMSLQQFSDARKVLKKALNKYPTNNELIARTDECAYNESQFMAADGKCKLADQMSGEEGSPELSEFLRSLYSYAIINYSKCSRFYRSRAKLELATSRAHFALKDSIIAMSLDPQDIENANVHIKVLMTLCRYEEAQKALDKAEELEFKDESVLQSLREELAEQLEKEKQARVRWEIAKNTTGDEARKHYEQAKNLQPMNRELLYEYIDQCLAQDEDTLEDAIFQANVLVSLHPTFAKGFAIAARLHLAKADTFEALVFIVSGLEVDEKDPELVELLFQVIIQDQKKQEDDFSADPTIEELAAEGLVFMDNICAEASKDLPTNDDSANNQEFGTMSLDDFLSAPTAKKSFNQEERKVTITSRKETQVNQNVALLSNAAEFGHNSITNFSQTTMQILKDQRMEAFTKFATILSVTNTDDFKRLVSILAKALELDEKSISTILKAVQDRKAFDKAVETCSTLFAMTHHAEKQKISTAKPFYHKTNFYDEDWTVWSAECDETLANLLEQCKIKRKDIKTASDDTSFDQERK